MLRPSFISTSPQAALRIYPFLSSSAPRCSNKAVSVAQKRSAGTFAALRQGGGGNASGPGGFFDSGGRGDDSANRRLYGASTALAFGASKMSAGSTLVKVVSFNVLSPPLANPKHFKYCDPADLDPHVRLERVLKKLQTPVSERAIICLQEVALSWAGPLHTFFAKHGFHVVLGTYGSYFNGYMGVALAFPTDVFDADDVRVQCLANTMRWPYIPKPTGIDAFLQSARKALTSTFAFFTGDTKAEKRRKSPWLAARERRNVLIFARLRARANGAEFCVGTYHMPCVWWSPPFMLIHCALALSTFQKLAGDTRALLAGDFNIKPGSSAYQMVTTGGIAPDDPDFPSNPPDGSPADKWFPKFLAMKSAYAQVNGAEPDFTNYARPGDAPTFIETLDYLFCSQNLDVVDVLKLPNRDKFNRPFPIEQEPSDHIMIGATVRLPAQLNDATTKSRTSTSSLNTR